ncbi:phosphohydrolase [Clostridium carboxidivorans P7]|uniref:Metal dependent phosphohydrolase n=1 Tax=Clostridium carboxidivorans P7 TaxID=536227 RepID=C6PWY0_9CLOT|nr:HD-GYP domain-containing protein [Clostridium carboxidivorans]AKN32156.1 phosphohydrolase [Clostridium carboxidivorans P7]EET86286.1 metal dependent phosphohydrolase [Clostridium carboxidivorans P7]
MLKEDIIGFNETEIYHDIIESLVTALEAKDFYTRGHSERVAFMAYELSKKLGIEGNELENIHMAAHLHDIGKIGVPDDILNKNEKLSEDEWKHIKMHPKIGFDILNKSNKLKHIAKIVLHHHEKWNGCGYPNKLAKLEIPLGSRIIAVCDSIDAMTSIRPYRKTMDFEQCMEEIVINKNIMYDPVIVDFIENNIKFIKDISNFKSV